LVENFRRHFGHLKIKARGRGTAGPTVSIGTGTVIDFAHPAQAIRSPIWDQPN
jgi:hypothetical protein